MTQIESNQFKSIQVALYQHFIKFILLLFHYFFLNLSAKIEKKIHSNATKYKYQKLRKKPKIQ